MANSTVKVTRSQALAMAIEGKTLSADAIEVLQKMKESIDKKGSDNSKAKAQAKAERDVIADKVFAYLGANGNEGKTITDLITLAELGAVSTPKVTASLTKDGRFTSVKDGKKSLYRIAE